MRRPRPSSYAGLLVAIAAAGIVGAFASCTDFTPPGGISSSSTLTVNPKTAHLSVGGTTQLRVIGASGTVTWSSSADTVATVSFGKVTGVASGTATIRAVSGTSRATATITVSRPAVISMTPTSIDFSGVASAPIPDSQTVAITNAGEDSLTALTVDSISYGAGATDWLSATLTSTDAPASLSLRPKTSALPAGSYTASVSISSPADITGPQFVAVRFTLGKPAAIALGTSTIAFTAQQAAAIPAQQSVAVTDTGDAPLTGLGVGTIAYSAGATGWLTASVNPTTAPASLLLRPNTTGLAPGDYSATVPVTSTIAGVAPSSLTVSYHISAAPPPPVIGVSPTSIAFTAGRNFGTLPAQQSVAITSSGVGTISGLSASVSYTGLTTGWLTQPSFAGGNTTAPTTLLVQPNSTSLPAGVYNATIHLTSTTAGVVPVDVPVTYVVSDLVLDQTSVQFSTTTATAPPDKVVSVSNGGGGSISNVTATVAPSNVNWLSATIANTVPQTPSATSLTLHISRADTLGDFTAQVTISAPGMVSKTVNVSYRRQATLAGDVMPVLQASGCVGCHTASNPGPSPGNFNISFANADSAYRSLLQPVANPGHTYVQVTVPGVSGDSSASNLFTLLNGLVPPAGYFNMPFGCTTPTSASCMNAQLRTKIYIWIQQGALKQ